MNRCSCSAYSKGASESPWHNAREQMMIVAGQVPAMMQQVVDSLHAEGFFDLCVGTEGQVNTYCTKQAEVGCRGHHESVLGNTARRSSSRRNLELIVDRRAARYYLYSVVAIRVRAARTVVSGIRIKPHCSRAYLLVHKLAKVIAVHDRLGQDSGSVHLPGCSNLTFYS